MNYSKYIGCRVEFVLWETKHTECRESGLLVRADGDGFWYKREEDGSMWYIDSSAHDFHAYMKPKDMNREQEFEYARSVCEKDGNMGFVGIDRCTDTDRIVYVDLSVGGMRDYKLDMNAEVDVTELFGEEGE